MIQCLKYIYCIDSLYQTIIRTPCLFISWLRKTVYSLSCCLNSPQLSSSDPRSSLVDSHNFSLILPCILLLCVRASNLYHWSTPVLGISYIKQYVYSYFILYFQYFTFFIFYTNYDHCILKYSSKLYSFKKFRKLCKNNCWY